MKQAPPILRTKLHRPPVSEDLVPRTRLHEPMNRGLTTPLTLVTAPAGYGKSAMVSHWCESLEIPSAWLSLGADDSDLFHFLRHCLAAVQSLFPEAFPDTASQLTTPVTVSEIARCLVNELDAIERTFVLVLDDYQCIATRSEVNRLVEFVLKHAPRSLRLVISTRRDPALALASMRAADQVVEVRMRDLCFTESETATLLERLPGREVSREALANLQRQTEGWVVGLRLVALSLRHVEDPDRFLKELRGGGVRYTRDYLMQEVIAELPPLLRAWLRASSILDRFCPGLCEAVCTTEERSVASELDGDGFVETLRRNGLFVVALDDRSEWFRFHPLFRSLLDEQLRHHASPEEIATLHLRASAWFEDHDRCGEAIELALEVHDFERAARIVEGHWRAVVDEGEWSVVAGWLSGLPDSIVQERAELLLARAWKHYHHLDHAAIPAILDRVDELLEGTPEAHELSGEVALFRGFCAYFRGDGARSLEFLERALDRIPVIDGEHREQGELLFGLAAHLAGEMERGTRTVTGWLQGSVPLPPRRELNLLWVLASTHAMSGDLETAARFLPRMREVADSNYLGSFTAWSDYLEGFIHLQRGHSKEAIPFLEEAGRGEHPHFTRVTAEALVALALAYQASGQPDRAASTLQSLRESVSRLGSRVFLVATSSAARLSLLQGHPETVTCWQQTDASPPAEVLGWRMEIPGITGCRLLVAEGSAASLEHAERRLREFAERSTAEHNTAHTIDALVLLSLALEKRGQGEEALTTLARAVHLAHPGGWVRPFVEPGPAVAEVLRRLEASGEEEPFIRRVLESFEQDAPEKSALGAGKARSSSGCIRRALLDPLTNRELDILELLVERLQNKEIAARCHISVHTVNDHLKRIYGKLNVHGRREAATRANALGLL